MAGRHQYEGMAPTRMDFGMFGRVVRSGVLDAIDARFGGFEILERLRLPRRKLRGRGGGGSGQSIAASEHVIHEIKTHFRKIGAIGHDKHCALFVGVGRGGSIGPRCICT